MAESYRRIYDANAMRSQRIGNMLNVDSVQVLVVAAFLDENLIIQIVQIFRYEMMNVPHDFQNIETLFECLRWQMIGNGV